jgi:uncharacterized membrane protein HdeD (DUF308 family)
VQNLSLEEMSMTNQRPTGVTILAILQFIGGALSLLGGLALMAFGGSAVNTGAGEVAAIPAMLGIVLILSGIIGLVAGYGLFTLKGWGWLLAIIFSVLNIISGLLNLFQGANIPSTIINLVISGLILYYLYTPVVRRAFGKL